MDAATAAGTKRPFLLASAPCDSLDACISACLAAGGEYTAGDAEDKLNSRVIGAEEAWRTAWKGKTHQAIKMLDLVSMDLSALSEEDYSSYGETAAAPTLTDRQVQQFVALSEKLERNMTEDMLVGQSAEDVSNAIIGAAIESGKTQEEVEPAMGGA